MKRLVLLAAAVGGLSCTSQPTILPSRDLSRPTDITFVCMGAFDPQASSAAADGGAADDGGAPAADDGSGLVLSGRPMRECHARTTSDPKPDAQHRTFAFMPNSANGLLTVVDTDFWKLVDLDPSIAGFNQLPLGRIPTQIASSDDGCAIVTANHGSCDLTLVDPTALLQSSLARGISGQPGIAGLSADATPRTFGAIAKTIVPTSQGHVLPLIPQEIAFVPEGTALLTGANQLCAATWQRQAIVTFPSCNLVALMNLPSGEIVDGVYVKRTKEGGVVSEPLAGRVPQCEVSDCSSPDAGATPDAGAPAVAEAGTDVVAASPGDGGIDGDSDAGDDANADGGGGPAPATVLPKAIVRPGPIAILPEGDRVYVGLSDAPFVVALDVTRDHLGVPTTATGGVIALHDGAIGTNRLRLSVDPYADKTTGGPGFAGDFVGGRANSAHLGRQYLYAVARDGTVRVVSVAQNADVECETNVDPLSFAGGASDPILSSPCLSVDMYRANRRATAQGPGFRFPTPAIDVAVADVASVPQDQSETSVAGAHAWILTSGGPVYLANIDPVRRLTAYVADSGDVKMCSSSQPTTTDFCQEEDDPPPNTLRNRSVVSYSRILDPSTGPPRLDVLPTAPTTGPRIESFWTRGTKANATADNTSDMKAGYIQTPVFFPDSTATTAQTWAVTWEGALMGGPRFSGQVSIDPTAGATLLDVGMDFCRLGLREGDIMSLHGCVDATQCGTNKICLRGTDGTQGAGGLAINGLCVDKETKVEDCSALLSTVRRYEVTFAGASKLSVVPHKDEIVRPDLDLCTPVPGSANNGGADGGASDGGTGGVSPDGGADAGGDAGTGDAGTAPLDKCRNPNDPTTAKFMCVPVPAVIDGKETTQNRCLMPCSVVGDTSACRSGRICVSYGAMKNSCGDGQCYCADGPDLGYKQNLDTCAGQLIAYQLQVGRGFLVSGSQTPLPATRAPVGASAHCEDLPGIDRRLAIRIPMHAETCTNLSENTDTLDSRCNPDPLVSSKCPDAAGTAKSLYNNATVAGGGQPTNPCLFNGGPNETDPAQDLHAEHVHALFMNSNLQFVMTNLERPPSGVFQLRFDVHGGFRAQTVIVPPSIEVGMPARIVLGPMDSRLPDQMPDGTPDVPYLFVVDQRSLGRTQGGGPTRGQLLRIHPRGFAITTPKVGSQPWFEDFTHSGELFPIQ